MAEMSIFEEDAFQLAALTVAINDTPYTPGRIGALGLFHEQGVPTLTVQIEKDGDTLVLVPAGERGGSGLVVTGSRRSLIPVNAVHLPQRFSILADEVQGIRAFGKTSELEAVQSRVNKRLEKCRSQLDITHEYQRLGAIRGQVLDADGKAVLLDIYRLFGISRPKPISMGLGDPETSIRERCSEILDQQEDALGGLSSTGSRAFCGRNFWNKFRDHKGVVDTYLNSEQAAHLRGDPHESFEFGGIMWERYRGRVAGEPFVADDEAMVVPEGVPDMFASWYAPADYMETVNTEGLPYYAKLERLPFDKGVSGEAQSNPLHINTRPRAVIRVTI